jgi:YidC/Oxa1 family membrane protein insertase
VQRETSALYEKAGVDPSAGCLPTLLTLPIFWGLYRALSNVAASGDSSIVDQGFYWVPSLSGPTSLAAQRAGTGTDWLLPFVDGAPPGGWDAAAPYLVLPVLLVLAQYASSAIISPAAPPQDGDEEGVGAQVTKTLVSGLPLLVGWFALNVPSGIALYYFANTVLTSGVQIWLRKLGGATAFEFQQEVGVSQAKRSEEMVVVGGEVEGEKEEAAVVVVDPSSSQSALPRAGEVGALEAAWILDFDASAVVKEAMATIASQAQAAEAAAAEAQAEAAAAGETSSEEQEAAKAAAALAALPVTTRSKRRRAGGLPEGSAAKLAEQDAKEKKERERNQSVGAGLLAAVRGQSSSSS